MSEIEIRKVRDSDLDEAWKLLEEYFEAVQVVVRDGRESVTTCSPDGRSCLWIALADGDPAGCIALRPLTEEAAEVKRLFVRPRFRRRGLALRLLSALESHALAIGLQSLYLDSKDDLREAIAFYQGAGYESCERYNNNPQATQFFQKLLRPSIQSGDWQIRDFRAGDEEAFWILNEHWISKVFKLEPKDIETLRSPQENILAKGGRIYIACRGEKAIGCCALLDRKDGSYEVSKMSVAESERGQGLGRQILKHVIADSRRLGIKRLYLETSHKLPDAIHLYESTGFNHVRPEDLTPSPYARSDVYMEIFLGS